MSESSEPVRSAGDARDSAGVQRLGAVLARMDGIVDWERRDRSAGMVRTLGAIEDLLRRLGDPHKSFQAVHVAGTKGKGSVSSLVAAALSGAGIRTGCYGSPHVERTTERVRIDGREVAPERLAAALEAAWAAREAAASEGSPAAEASWFDLMTAAAFRLFAKAGCPWAVVECGLGGRLDSTRPVAGRVAVVTNVDLEHTAVLGCTRTAIAAEKGAILEPGATLLTAAEPHPGDDPLPVLARIAAERGGRLLRVEARGGFEQRNAALAAAVLDQLGSLGVRDGGGAPIGASALTVEARQSARLPAREELFEYAGRKVLLDGAHVASSVRELLRRIPEDVARPIPAVLALGRDKDAPALLKALRTCVDRVHCTSPPNGPLLPADELAALSRESGFATCRHAEPLEALRVAVSEAPPDGWVIALGSFYLAGAIRPFLAADKPRGIPPAPC